MYKHFMGNGDCINIKNKFTLCLDRLENNLCHSNYLKAICVREGELIGHFTLKFHRDVKKFTLATRDIGNEIPKSIMFKTSMGLINISIDGYQPGKTRDLAKLGLLVEYIAYNNIICD